MSKTSYIRGKAEVVFGGAIKIMCGTSTDGDFVLGLAELKEQKKVGDTAENEEAYDPQVLLVFNNLDSVTIVRNALECVEQWYKEGYFKEQIEKQTEDEY